MATRIQLRRGSTTEWTSANPVLAAGEPGTDLTTGDLRVGNGTTPWASLPSNLSKVTKGEQVISVRDYGAVGDGTTDDTAAFVAAIAAAAAQRRILLLPGGHYKITATLDLPNGLIMRGSGMEPVNGTPTRLNFSTLTGTTPAITITDGSNITLSDFYISGRAAGSASEVSFTGNSRAITVERVTVNSATTGACLGIAVGTGSVIKSEFRNVTTSGGAQGFWIGPACTSLLFSTCYAQTATTAGFLIQGTYLAFVACAADQNALYAYTVQNAVAVSFEGCGSEVTGRTGWHLTNAKHITLVGCRAVSNNSSANAAVPSFMGVNDGSDFVTAIGCIDTTPNAATVNSVRSWNGTAPTVVTLSACDFTAKGVGATVPQTALAAVTTTTAPTAGAAGALPATPAGYATVTINGVARKVAYY